MGLTETLELISAGMTGAVLPLIYFGMAVGVIEYVLGHAYHPLSFKGLILLGTHMLHDRPVTPAGRVREHGRTGGIQYMITDSRELLFTGRPRLVGVQYMIKVRAVDRGGSMLLETRASLSMCVAACVVGLLFLGLALGSFLTEGRAAGAAFLLIGAGLIWLLSWRVRIQIRKAPQMLRAIIEHLQQEDDEEERGCDDPNGVSAPQ